MKMEYNKNPKIVPPEIDEAAGEILCDVCKGVGNLPSKIQPHNVVLTCWKCQGSGKLDWVSHIMEKAPPKQYKFSANGSFQSYKHDDMIDAMSYAIANSIDKEIVDTILNDSNKHIKNHNQEGK